MVARQIARAGLPASAEVVLVRRYGAYIVPTGRTRLRREDHITVLARMSEPLSFCVPYTVTAGDSESAA